VFPGSIKRLIAAATKPALRQDHLIFVIANAFGTFTPAVIRLFRLNCPRGATALVGRVTPCAPLGYDMNGAHTVTRPTPGLLRLACLVFLFAASCALGGDRLTLNFNPDWRFIKADPPGAAQPGFDDRAWTNVSAPHTFNDTDTFDDWSLSNHRGEQNQWAGRTWYRKTFTLPESFKGKKVYLEFEAVRQVAEVYLNGDLLGVSRTGFTPFGFDLTRHLRFNGPNVLAVMCDNRFMKDPSGSARSSKSKVQSRKSSAVSQRPGTSDSGLKTESDGPSLGEISAQVNAAIPDELDKLQADQIPWNNPHWHPAQGGIYRNVRLYVTDPLHISLPLYSFLQTEGPYAYASDISGKAATVTVEIPVDNGRRAAETVAVGAEIFDHDGKSVAALNQSADLAVGASTKSKLSIKIPNPKLWQPDYPYLYRVVCSLRIGGRTIDSQEIPFGIRAAHWDTQGGFHLNGQPVKLHGWGQKPTDEWPGLGAAQPDWMHFFTLDLMKEAGGNFVRWGHCAGGPASIAAGDRLGIIADQPGVDGESDTRGAAWTLRARAFRDTLIYFRNHPSILIWEGGNQKVTSEHARELRDLMDKYDPHGGRAYAHRRADQKTAEFMNVGIGTEGGREIARLPVVEGEYDREESPRRVWDDFSPPNFGYPEAKGQTYQLTSEQFAVNQISQFVRKLGAPDHCGGANWIFSDSTSGGRVACEVARASGEVDGVRLPKEAFYACKAMFRSDPQVHIIGHWTYPAGTKKTVYAVSNCEGVEMLVHGKSIGHGKVSDRYLFTFPDVVWEEGEIKAIGYAGGKAVALQFKRTAGAPVALRLTPVRSRRRDEAEIHALTTNPPPYVGGYALLADGSDVALIDVEAVDAHGQRCPTFQQRVDFEIEGPGIWRGGYNSGKTNSINNPFLDLECGINRVAVRSTRTAGEIKLRAKNDGLKPAGISIESKAIAMENGSFAELPTLPGVPLPKEPPAWNFAASASSTPASSRQTNAMVGHFTKAFSYSGPTAIVHLERNAQDGKKIYVDRDFPFTGLPPELRGADYVQAADKDSLYNAMDLMEIAVVAGSIISIAHDDRLVRPAWLTRQFKPTDLKLTVHGQTMRVFQHRAESDESLTLGANADEANASEANMYVVFVSAAAPEKR
jgi:beta-galactosidase